MMRDLASPSRRNNGRALTDAEAARYTMLSLRGLGIACVLVSVVLAIMSLAQVAPVLAGIVSEQPIAVHVTGGTLDRSVGLLPGDRVALTPIVIDARGGDMLYALHADLEGPDELIRQLNATARTADGVLLYDGPFAELSIGAGERGSPERRLAGGAAERLSVTVTLSIDAGNEIQGASLAIVWRAEAVASAGTTTDHTPQV